MKRRVNCNHNKLTPNKINKYLNKKKFKVEKEKDQVLIKISSAKKCFTKILIKYNLI